MIYYMFSEKERRELEDLVLNELTIVNSLLRKVEGIDRGDVIKERALKEKQDLLLSLINKVSNYNQKKYNL
ncbi:hypothetical protein [Metabacillus sediminilitoris]|uniref:Uncharacterized protein n=1 Tax=Metabacillus sediminilitoris TaxID=2567941 RepID=A0A4S4BMU2_9BACI|nr:hypothetical protein [Metabacillus sediminilitoris]QGQ44036.1 hypothetical protein GMB29_00950 [Metabacillus sediminilitoris]THF76119.1 hypothetical protein E6W99_21905 [Metabacillus sediminilitoris]